MEKTTVILFLKMFNMEADRPYYILVGFNWTIDYIVTSHIGSNINGFSIYVCCLLIHKIRIKKQKKHQTEALVFIVMSHICRNLNWCKIFFYLSLEWVSVCCLTPTQHFFQLYHGENKLIVNGMMIIMMIRPLIDMI